jgi:hypothetical protein
MNAAHLGAGHATYAARSGLKMAGLTQDFDRLDLVGG